MKHHEFSPSQIDQTKCSICKFEQIDHTDRATCESCGNSGNCEIYDRFNTKMLLCEDCISKNNNIQHVPEAKNNGNSKQPLDFTIHNWTDIFNARPTPIAELKKQIDEDPAIENKHFALAQVLDAQHKQWKTILPLFNAKLKELTEADMQRQLFYNAFAKQLREEERKKISIQDVTYKPEPPKEAKPKKVTTTKYDKVALANAAKESGYPEASLFNICRKRDCTPIEAVRIMKELMGE